MNIEEASIDFLEFHVENTFSNLCKEYVIENINWLEDPFSDCARPYAIFFESNIIALFPIFCQKKNIKK